MGRKTIFSGGNNYYSPKVTLLSKELCSIREFCLFWLDRRFFYLLHQIILFYRRMVTFAACRVMCQAPLRTAVVSGCSNKSERLLLVQWSVSKLVVRNLILCYK